MRRAEGLLVAVTIVVCATVAGWGIWTEISFRREGDAFCVSRGMVFHFGPRSPAYCAAPDGRMYDYPTLKRGG